jgi:hypothetical protein
MLLGLLSRESTVMWLRVNGRNKLAFGVRQRRDRVAWATYTCTNKVALSTAPFQEVPPEVRTPMKFIPIRRYLLSMPLSELPVGIGP